MDPLFKKLYAEWPDYKEVSNSRKHEQLSFICNREKHHALPRTICSKRYRYTGLAAELELL